jgi:DNA mismatch repair ATPase MutS
MCDEKQNDGRLVLFLLDEIFHGTNSHDRRIGAELVLRRFLDAGAIGLVTTHDLALARLAETLAPAAANVHFEDSIADGQIHFDHRLRPGPVQRGNALALLQMVGLIDEPGPG